MCNEKYSASVLYSNSSNLQKCSDTKSAFRVFPKNPREIISAWKTQNKTFQCIYSMEQTRLLNIYGFESETQLNLSKCVWWKIPNSPNLTKKIYFEAHSRLKLKFCKIAEHLIEYLMWRINSNFTGQRATQYFTLYSALHGLCNAFPIAL